MNKFLLRILRCAAGLIGAMITASLTRGIDVAHRVADDSWVAIQVKFYKPTTSIQKGLIDSFFEASSRSFVTEKGREHFSHRYIISTTDR